MLSMYTSGRCMEKWKFSSTHSWYRH